MASDFQNHKLTIYGILVIDYQLICDYCLKNPPYEFYICNMMYMASTLIIFF